MTAEYITLKREDLDGLVEKWMNIRNGPSEYGDGCHDTSHECAEELASLIAKAEPRVITDEDVERAWSAYLDELVKHERPTDGYKKLAMRAALATLQGEK